MKKGAGMSSEQMRIHAISSNKTNTAYQDFMKNIQNRVKHALQNKLNDTTDKVEKQKLESLLDQIGEIIQSMGVLKFVVTFAGLPDYAYEYKHIWNDCEKLKILLTTLQNTQLNIDGLMSRFMHMYDHDAFAGDLDKHSSLNYLDNTKLGTYLIRISQTHCPGGFTFSVKCQRKEKDCVEHRFGFFFSGNNNEIIYDNNTTYKNLTDVIEQFDFNQKLESPVQIYGITLGDSWRTKNKY